MGFRELLVLAGRPLLAFFVAGVLLGAGVVALFAWIG